jgi:hypothetical protein
MPGLDPGIFLGGNGRDRRVKPGEGELRVGTGRKNLVSLKKNTRAA